MADTLGTIGMLNVFGTVLYMYIIAFRLKKEIKKRYIIYYALAWSIVYVVLAIIMVNATGQIVTSGDLIGAIALNIVSFFIVFLILDFIAFYLCRFLYERIPQLHGMFNKQETEEEIKPKHKMKDEK